MLKSPALEQSEDMLIDEIVKVSVLHVKSWETPFTWLVQLVEFCCYRYVYSAFTETGATQTMKTNQKVELKQQIPTFSNPANQMPSTKQWNLNLFVDRWCLRDYSVG